MTSFFSSNTEPENRQTSMMEERCDLRDRVGGRGAYIYGISIVTVVIDQLNAQSL